MLETNVSGTVRYSLLPVILILMANTFGDNLVDSREGKFISLKQLHGREVRAFVAGPENAKAGILVVHDYFGISDATERAVEHLGAIGYP